MAEENSGVGNYYIQTQSAAAGINIQPFNGKAKNVATVWKEWKQLFEAGIRAFKCTDPEEKFDCLMFRGGADIIKLLDTLPDSEDDSLDKYSKAIKKLDNYFLPRKNKIFERHLLRGISQLESESFDKFVVRIREQANNCELGNFFDEAVIDQIVEGCSSKDLKTKCLAAERSLNEVINLGNSLEAVGNQVKIIDGGDFKSGTESINKVSTTRKSNHVASSSRLSNRENRNSEQLCSQCGGRWFTGHRVQCKAVNHLCTICRKKGHMETKCYSRKRGITDRNDQLYRKRNKFRTDTCNEVDGSDMFSDVEDEVVNYIDGDIDVTVRIGGVFVSLIVDSGSSANLLDEATFKKLQQNKFIREEVPLEYVRRRFVAYASKQPLTITNAFRTTVNAGTKETKAMFYVISGSKKSLLSRGTSSELNILKIQVPENCFAVEIKKSFPCMKGIQAHLLINEAVHPVAQSLRRVPVAFEKKIDDKIQELLELGIIEEVHDPNPGWISPVVPVGKSDGDLRLCVDMRKANQALVREAYPLPTFDNILVRLRKASLFSKLDLKNAYHQVELAPESRNITTFLTKRGLFRYTRLMFGISVAPEKFQKIIDNLLAGCDGVAPYLDDILIFGESKKEHDFRLEKVLSVFDKFGVLLNHKKCVFAVEEVVFMGHRISSNGVSPLEAKIVGVQNFREPQNSDEVRSFLGLVTYHARFIRDLATKSEPLRMLLKKDQKFVWNKQQEESFRYLKTAISSKDTLGYFDQLDFTKLICDASPVALGAVLLQEDRNSRESRTIAYASRSLTETEKKYYHTEKEALALVWGIERFKYYLTGLKFQLITDCKPLEFLFKPTSKPCARIERWILRLQSFNFDIKYKPGKTNLADPFSRLVKFNDAPSLYDKDTEEYVFYVVTAASEKLFSLQDLKELTLNDGDLTELKNSLRNDNWNNTTLPFKIFKDEICESDDLLLRGTRVIPPKSLRDKILSIAHEGHLGMSKMKQRLRASYWWPALDKDVETLVKNCMSCLLVSAVDPPPPVSRRTFPDGPWQHLAVDFMGPIGARAEYIFVVVDYYSRFMEIVFMQTTTVDKVIYSLRQMIGRYGYPTSITADNGPQFRSSDFIKFCEEEGITLNLTTPYWPQANGEVERQNRSLLKRIKISIQENRNWKSDLLKYQAAYHITPHSITGKAPAELFKGIVREKFPRLQNDFRFIDESARDLDRTKKEQSRVQVNIKRRTKENSISEGDCVIQKRIHKCSKTDPNFEPKEHKVIELRGNEAVIQDSGTGIQYRRHIHHLKKLNPEINRPTTVEAASTGSSSAPIDLEETEQGDGKESNRPKRFLKKPTYLADYV